MKNDIIDDNFRVIAKKSNHYLVINKTEDESISYFDLCKIVNHKGKQFTRWIPLGVVMREKDWELINKKYSDVVEQRKRTTVDGLLGFAVGDALGVPVEFLDREMVKRLQIKDMRGCDQSNRIMSTWGMTIPSGAWSDDTSMLIAGMDSLVKTHAEVDYDDVMKKYLSWWDNDEYTSTDEAFGLGECVEKAFKNYRGGKAALESGGELLTDNGNGSLMRILPFAMICIELNLTEEETQEYISNASRLTHAHSISRLGCFIYTEYLRKIIETSSPMMALSYIRSIEYSKYFDRETILAYKKLLHPSFSRIKEEDIKSTGYVVDTLEAVIYSVTNGTNYEDTVLKAINLGEDTDTIGGITGSIAGMLYGKEAIPNNWLEKLKRKEYLEELAMSFDKELKTKIEEQKKNIKQNKL